MVGFGAGRGDDSRLKKFSSSGGKTHSLPPVPSRIAQFRRGRPMPSRSLQHYIVKAMLQIFTRCGIQAKGKGSTHPGGISRRCCGENGDT